MNRRNFLHLLGCGCLSIGFQSCATAPITERKQLKFISEAKLNAQAKQIYEKVKKKEKLINDENFSSIKEKQISYHKQKKRFFRFFFPHLLPHPRSDERSTSYTPE